MPALSPTMETGILSEWYIQEGAGFIAGQSVAKIETDKASIDFEAQDDGFIAKFLMEAGTGVDIVVGTPIMVTVEEESDVAAFANFTAPAVDVVAAAAEAPPPPKPEAPKVEAAAPAPAPVVKTAPAPAPVVAAVPPPTMEAMVAAVAPVMSTGWGEFAKLNSPLIKTLSKQQKDYISKYGTTGQVPL
jgi:pyruvate dehydrogenase E2 component (dihydrolipoamide acetyltransferase)